MHTYTFTISDHFALMIVLWLCWWWQNMKEKQNYERHKTKCKHLSNVLISFVGLSIPITTIQISCGVSMLCVHTIQFSIDECFHFSLHLFLFIPLCSRSVFISFVFFFFFLNNTFPLICFHLIFECIIKMVESVCWMVYHCNMDEQSVQVLMPEMWWKKNKRGTETSWNYQAI